MTFRLQQLTDAQVEHLGRFCAELLAGESQWIFRRRESVTVLDDATVRRQQSVDFTLDTIDSLNRFRSINKRLFGEGICAAPLFILDKDPASALAFDLEEESGRTLSLMTTAENGEISAATLKVLVTDKLQGEGYELSPALEEKLSFLATSESVEGSGWLERLENPLLSDPDRDELECLWADRQLAWWLRTLAYHSIVLIAFDTSLSHRRVIKIVYEQPMTKGPALNAKLAWRSFKVLLDVPLIRSARYHFDVKAPPGFRLTHVVLDSVGRGSVSAPGVRRWGQIYLDDISDARSAIARFGLRVSGQGILGGALVAAALVLAAILVCIAHREDIANHLGSAPALLLVLPGIIATYVARADEHGLTTRLLAVPRWVLLLASGVSAYFAAGVIAVWGDVDGNLPPQERAQVVQVHAAKIDHLLQYPKWAAVFSVVLIGIGWLCSRELTHMVLRGVGRLWGLRKYAKNRFRIKADLRAHHLAVWNQIMVESERLINSGYLQTRITTESYGEWVIHRSLGPFNWTHGIKLQTAPCGTHLAWVFRADGPLLFRPFLFGLVAWEALVARYRIRRFKWKIWRGVLDAPA
jgi:hypothetical protein